MKLAITREELVFLSHLGRHAEQKKGEYESALRDFRIAFEASMRARAISDATFVSLSDEGLDVTTPDTPPPLSLVQDEPPPEAA